MIAYGQAICYSGYRNGQSPISKIYPSNQDILQDLNILKKHFKYIRMYDISDHAKMVLEVIKTHHIPLKVMLGVEPKGEISNPNCPWGGLHTEEAILRHKKENYEQLDILANLCQQYEDIVLAASVGNESTSDWHPNLMDSKTLYEHVIYLKSKIKHPVTFCEGAYYWYHKNEQLAQVVDFISIHSYPVWLKVPLKDAFNETVSDYQKVTSKYPNQQVIFTEYGWPTASNEKMNQNETHEETQKIYFDQVLAWQKTHQITMFMFEAFDEPWKGSEDIFEPEKHWGIYDVQREPKLFAQSFFYQKK